MFWKAEMKTKEEHGAGAVTQLASIQNLAVKTSPQSSLGWKAWPSLPARPTKQVVFAKGKCRPPMGEE